MQEAFATNWIAPLGPNFNGFEADLENYNKVAHVAALSAGTAAIHLVLDILNVGPDDLVLVQSFTFCGSANPITYRGAQPVFIDSEDQTWNMDPATLKHALEDLASQGKIEKVKAIMPVHLYGMPAQMDEIMALAAEYNIPVIEDAAESLGSTYKQQFTGTIGKNGSLLFQRQ